MPSDILSSGNKGDFDDGGQYCIGFGGSTVDRRFSKELLKVISPFGVQASLKAIEELSCSETAPRAALSSKLERLRPAQAVVLRGRRTENQALDYWIRVRWHVERGELQHLFPSVPLANVAPKLFLIAPGDYVSFNMCNSPAPFFVRNTVERAGINSEWQDRFASYCGSQEAMIPSLIGAGKWHSKVSSTLKRR